MTAYEQSQKYKVGHYILEKALIIEIDQEPEQANGNEKEVSDGDENSYDGRRLSI